MSPVDRQLTASQKAIAENREQPHLNNHEIVLELAKHEERLDDLEEANIALQDKIKELEALVNPVVEPVVEEPKA